MTTSPKQDSIDRGTKPQKWKNDLILIGILLPVALLFSALLYFFQGEGKQVTVSIGGEHSESYSLNVDGRFELSTGADHMQHNVLVIENGAARIESADCPDLICVRHSPISRKGETIVCLPNQMVIAIE